MLPLYLKNFKGRYRGVIPKVKSQRQFGGLDKDQKFIYNFCRKLPGRSKKAEAFIKNSLNLPARRLASS
ncbi:MAG: hypothetical protein C0186_06405 [Thermodesulfovibrio aggregans]|uniref:Uncharacterized protein n=1 Tax=Thermodesulfovibrio aggregans TaxID=86166 RepID=A0A2J6WGV2_9BACT|nr:MAG: hypothetical protein C0186_06405 [Thermodesulfovibrio aggregans]